MCWCGVVSSPVSHLGQMDKDVYSTNTIRWHQDDNNINNKLINVDLSHLFLFWRFREELQITPQCWWWNLEIEKWVESKNRLLWMIPDHGARWQQYLGIWSSEITRSMILDIGKKWKRIQISSMMYDFMLNVVTTVVDYKNHKEMSGTILVVY